MNDTSRPTGLAACLMLLALGGACVGFRSEDHGFAADVAAQGVLLDLKGRLSCAYRALGQYPEALDALASDEIVATCGPISRYLSHIVSPAKTVNGAPLAYEHQWIYVRRREGRGYTLSCVDTRGRVQYHSFWLDEGGLLRSARGRAAGPADPVDEWQRSGQTP